MKRSDKFNWFLDGVEKVKWTQEMIDGFMEELEREIDDASREIRGETLDIESIEYNDLFQEGRIIRETKDGVEVEYRGERFNIIVEHLKQ